MVCIGSKSISSRRPNTSNFVGMPGEENLSNWEGKKMKKNRRPAKEHKHNAAGGSKAARPPTSSNHQNVANPDTSLLRYGVSLFAIWCRLLVSDNRVLCFFCRKQVDPETTKYFTEIANVLAGNGVDYEERAVICGNALEEATGKELELATDYIISHTLQALLEGCDVDHLCGFLRSCADEFPLIAIDRSGSHVAETALRSLTMHDQVDAARSVIEETLTKICQVQVINFHSI